MMAYHLLSGRFPFWCAFCACNVFSTSAGTLKSPHCRPFRTMPFHSW